MDALTLSRQRYLERLEEPRFATVPSLLAQLAAAVVSSSERGAITSDGGRLPLDPRPVELLTRIGRDARGRCALAGLRPRRPDVARRCRCAAPAAQCAVYGTYGLACCPHCRHPHPVPMVVSDLRQLAAYARRLAGTDFPAVVALAEVVLGWRADAEELLPETRTGRDLPDLTCQGCGHRRVREPQPDGRVILAPALRYVATPMPGVQCRGCEYVYRGDGALRALAAWQGSERAGAA